MTARYTAACATQQVHHTAEMQCSRNAQWLGAPLQCNKTSAFEHSLLRRLSTVYCSLACTQRQAGVVSGPERGSPGSGFRAEGERTALMSL